MIESKALLAFIKMHEAKLQAKIYTHRYERLIKNKRPDIELETYDERYNDEVADEDWLDIEEPDRPIRGSKALNFYK